MKRVQDNITRLLLLLAIPAGASAQGQLTQVHQDFSKDPGWEWKNNRIVAQDPPTVKQDFGWAPTNHTGSGGPGKIGGRIWRSVTPAYYALPLNRPLSFKDNSAGAEKRIEDVQTTSAGDLSDEFAGPAGGEAGRVAEPAVDRELHVVHERAAALVAHLGLFVRLLIVEKQPLPHAHTPSR